MTTFSTDGTAIAADPPLANDWHLDRINQRTATLDKNAEITKTGKGVTIYIFDSGIRTTHKQFGGRASTGTVTASDPDSTSCPDHGTGVASMAAGRSFGVAKAAKLVSVRGSRCIGNSSVSEMAAAIDWITVNAHRPAVVNLSWGVLDPDGVISDAIKRSVANGITYVAAAGNDGADACTNIPQQIPEVITVGATTAPGRKEAMTYRSNWGKCVDLLAPGENLTVASATGDNNINHGITGTSLSGPMVAGAAALYLEDHPDAPPAEVANWLIARSTKEAVDVQGTGTPNRLLYVGPETDTNR